MVSYKPGSHFLVPPRWTVNRKLVTEVLPNDTSPKEFSHRTWQPQKYYFDVNKRYNEPPQFEYQQRRFEYYDVETKLIWKAFDTPERLGMFFADYAVRGYKDAFRPEWLDAASHWVRESRFWRAIGIHKPFYDEHTLRVNCWANNNTDVGRIAFSEAMIEAVMDLERALKRKNQGLDPNYLWDHWGPAGFIDGRMTHHLPRPLLAPYIDPDGVEVTQDEVAPYTSAEALKERYKDFIAPDSEPFAGAFLLPSHGRLTLDDIEPRVKDLYLGFLVDDATTAPDTRPAATSVDPSTFRDLAYLSANTSLVDSASVSGAKTWQDVQAAVAPLRTENDFKVDAAQLLFHTTREVDATRQYFEEKCGWPSFVHVNDRTITGAALAYLADLKLVASQPEWGAQLCLSHIDLQREKVLGSVAYSVFRHLEDMRLNQRRLEWSGRFGGEANEEKTLDFMLQSLSKRSESRSNEANIQGEDFDREREPIGRTVQRRQLASDLQQSEKRKPFTSTVKLDPFERLHKGQVTGAVFK